MPELPEVETTVRGLARHLDGARIERVMLNRPDMRFPFPDGLVQALTGATVTGLGRRAKYGSSHRPASHDGVPSRHERALANRSDGDRQARPSRARDRRATASRCAIRGGSASSTSSTPRRSMPGRRSRRWARAARAGLTPSTCGRAFAGGGRRSSCCCSTSASSPGSATSTSARRCSARDRSAQGGGAVSGPLARLVPAIREVLEQAIGDGGSTLRDYARPDGELGILRHAVRRLRPRGQDVYARRRRHDRRVVAGRAQHLVLFEVPEVSRFA
jgi:formamidopyrimidine-DNA glycosylase